MNKKRILVTLVVLAVLCLLVYLQVRTWKRFDWHTFWQQTEHVSWLLIFAGVVLTYASYALRAVRWKIFLKPVCKTTTTTRLMAPQFIGFTALALLGRAGEVVRPYIIARKENLTFASQMAVWTVERIFDMGGFAVLLALSFLSPDLRALPFYHGLRQGAFALIALVLGLVVAMVVIRKSGEQVANILYNLFARSTPRFAHHLREKIISFSVGLETIQGIGEALQLTAISIFMWMLIAVDYIAITHAYPGALHETTLPMAVLLMGASMVGSLLQLPGVGGGSQLATIGMLSAGFGISHELAVSCGMLLWAVTFMSVIPAGLLLARGEHVSLRAIEEAEEKAAALSQ
jgi:glycosyltransferase 2 family protein